MYRCKPQGMFTYNSVIEGEGQSASLHFDWQMEYGDIIANGTAFEVLSSGWLSGQWTLNREGKTVRSAKKSLNRKFEIQSSHETLTLKAKSPLTREFELFRSGEKIARITPKHLFSRQATIDTFNQSCDFATLSFSFWLVLLIWRRSSD